MTPTSDQTRCVVLKAAEAATGESLEAAIQARGWTASIHRDPYLAMAELCLREWAQGTRASWGLIRLERTVLVVEQPGEGSPSAPEIDMLLVAAERYAPGVEVWLYADGQLQLHTAASVPDSPDSAQAVEPQSDPAPVAGDFPASQPPWAAPIGSGSAPRLRLAATCPPSDSEDTPDEAPDPESTAEAIVDEPSPGPEAGPGQALPLPGLVTESDEWSDAEDEEDEEDEGRNRSELTRAEIDMLLGPDRGATSP